MGLHPVPPEAFCIREDYLCGILFRLRIHHGTGSARGSDEAGEKRTRTTMSNCCRSAEAYFVEVNLHLKYTMLAFVRYLWQRKADLEKNRPARLQCPVVLRLRRYQGTKCSPSYVGRGANSALSLLLGSASSSCVFFPFFESCFDLSRCRGSDLCSVGWVILLGQFSPN